MSNKLEIWIDVIDEQGNVLFNALFVEKRTMKNRTYIVCVDDNGELLKWWFSDIQEDDQFFFSSQIDGNGNYLYI